ncbi:hypothetical protein [Halococcus sediminicola]|uniref:hypothetical protein n=1 Tax=Halococcus sediminicola TaxID=1264579 RepID=UPI000679933D|nr:hypothetical protein [Halococcus sediminicola]
MFDLFGEETEMATIEFGEVEAYHLLYRIEKGGTNHEYSTYVDMHGHNLGSDGRVNVDLNIDPDESEFDADTIREGEQFLEALIDEQCDLPSAKFRHE